MSDNTQTLQDELASCKEQLRQLQEIAKELGETTTKAAATVKDIVAKKDLFVKHFGDVQKSLADIALAAGPPTAKAETSKLSERGKIVLTSLLTLVAAVLLALLTVWLNIQSAKDIEFAKVLATQAFPDVQKVKSQMNITFAALNDYLANLGDNSQVGKRKAYVDDEDALSKALVAATLPQPIKARIQQTITHFQDAKLETEKMLAGPDRDTSFSATMKRLTEEINATYSKIDEWLFPPSFRG
jgi:hypothetical protein